jgi:hypothetical protein
MASYAETAQEHKKTRPLHPVWRADFEAIRREEGTA